MCEVGVYRISGVSGEIQRLKKAFEKSITLTLLKLCIIICGLLMWVRTNSFIISAYLYMYYIIITLFLYFILSCVVIYASFYWQMALWYVIEKQIMELWWPHWHWLNMIYTVLCYFPWETQVDTYISCFPSVTEFALLIVHLRSQRKFLEIAEVIF